MRKSTKNRITKVIRGILIIFTVIIALITSLYAAIRDITVQSIIVRSAAGILSETLNTDVKIKTFYVTPDLEIHIRGLYIEDIDGYPLFEIGELSAQPTLSFPLTTINVKDVYIKDVLGRIVTYEGNKLSNMAEILSMIPKSEKEEKDSGGINLAVGNVEVKNAHFILWNQNRHQPEKKGMDYSHLDVDNINLHVKDFQMLGDSIVGNIVNLTGRDRCGADIKSFGTELTFYPKGVIMHNLKINLNNILLDTDLEFRYNNSSAFNSFVDSVTLVANFRPTHLVLSDIKYWSSALERMPDTLDFSLNFFGTINDFSVSDLDISFGRCSNIRGSISMKDICNGTDNSYWVMKLPGLKTSYDDLVNFHIPSSSVTLPIPEALKPMGNIVLDIDYKGTFKDLALNVNAKTGLGDVTAKVNMAYDSQNTPFYDATIVTNDINLTKIIKSEDKAMLTAAFSVNGHGFDPKTAEASLVARFKSFEFKRNVFDNFTIDATLKDKMCKVNSMLIRPNIKYNLLASADFSGDDPVVGLKGNIYELNLNNMHFVESDSSMIVSTYIDVDVCGFSLDKMNANVFVENTTYRYGHETYSMDSFKGYIKENNGVRSAQVLCDFFDLNVEGMFDYDNVVNSIKHSITQHANIESLQPSKPVAGMPKQEFVMSLVLKDTETLTRLFMPKLHVSQGTSFAATFTSGDVPHGHTFECPSVMFGDIKVTNLDIRNIVSKEGIESKIFVDDILLRDSTENSPERYAFKNVLFTTNIKNDTVDFTLFSDDKAIKDRYMADVKATFIPHEDYGGKFILKKFDVMMADTLLVLEDMCGIDITKDKIAIDNFDLHTDMQHIKVDGTVPYTNQDTISVMFQNMDMSDFDFLLTSMGIYTEGIIDGNVTLSGIKDNMFMEAGLGMKDVYINGRVVGDVNVATNWNNQDKSIGVDVGILYPNQDSVKTKTFELIGKYFPQQEGDNMDINLNVDGFKMYTIAPILSSVADRVDGELNGNVKIGGSLSKPVLGGILALEDVSCRIKFLNTYYTINDTIDLAENSINFVNLKLMDTLHNKAFINGAIRHNYLKDFNFDILMKCDDFAAMNIPAEKAHGFYGSAIASGDVRVYGPVNDIHLDIDVSTIDGTEINVPLNGSGNVDSSFITFVDNNAAQDDTTNTRELKTSSNLTIDLAAGVTPDTKVNIFLPAKMGKISASGSGNINIGVYPDNFTLNGNYEINNGQIAFTLQMISKNFNIRKGGKIRFNGDPTDADINIASSYHTKVQTSSLAGMIDTTMINQTSVPVDCILRLSGKLMNPSISFGLEFPNSTDDFKTSIYRSIDTTNQTVMAQHAMSLMVVGMFANTNNIDIRTLGTTATYGIINGLINNTLSDISKNFDIGINYRPGSTMSKNEVELALSTQLFDDRLLIEGNVGMSNNNNSSQKNASNVVGDIDVSLKLTNVMSLKAYNHTNMRGSGYDIFASYSDYTQGLGIVFSQNFNNFTEIFDKKNMEWYKKKDKKDKNKDKDSKKEKKKDKNKDKKKKTEKKEENNVDDGNRQ